MRTDFKHRLSNGLMHAAIVAVIGLSLGGFSAPSMAQFADDTPLEDMPDVAAKPPVVVLPQASAVSIDSLFWTQEEMVLLDQIKRGAIIMPQVEEFELQTNDTVAVETPIYAGYRVPRDLRVGGLLYKSSEDWVFWINGIRVTPSAKIKELKHVKVYQNYVEIKWFDAMTNTIYPVRIKPAQRFNIDARNFLPG